MPRNVRNWWLTATVDGKKSSVATGPRASTGGFQCTVRQRADGAIYDELITLEGLVDCDGLLELRIWDGDTLLFSRNTRR